MFENMTNEDVSKIKRRITYIRRFLNKYLTAVLFSLYIFWFPIFLTKDHYYGFFVTPNLVYTGAVLTLLLLYSAIHVVNVYNDEMALRFIQSETPIKNLSDKLRFIFSQKENRFELALLAILYTILPIGFTGPAFAWILVGDERGFLAKCKMILVLFPIFTIIYILSNLTAIKYWDTEERRKIENKYWQSEKEQNTATKKEKRDFRHTFFWMLVGYFAGSIILMFYFPLLIPMFSMIFKMVVNPVTLIIAILVVLLPTIIRTISALRKRKKFIAELKRVCKQRRYVLSKIKAPYKSIFFLQEGESFNVRIGDRRFSCKLVTCKNKSIPLYVLKKGIAAWLVRVKFISIELFSYTKSFDFSWEADCKKVVIFNPTPKQLYTPKGDVVIPDEVAELYVSPKRGMGLRPMIAALGPKTSNALELDNGDIVDGYEVYSATPFLNALERDVIDID